MADKSLIERFQNAMQVLRGAKSVSEAPDFGRSAPTSVMSDWRVPGWNWPRYKNTSIDFSGEIGSLDGNSLVMAVVNYTGTRLPEAKPVVVRRNAEGDEEKDFNHPAATLIRRPNPHHVWANYALGSSLSWWIDGNVFFKKVRNIAGQVIELWYIPHHLIEPRWPNDGKSPEVPKEKDQSTFLSHYQFSVPGREPELWPASDVIHLKRGALTENRRAMSPFAPLVKELYGDDKMASFTATIMRNMGIQVPLISPKQEQSIDATRAAQMKEQWMQKTTGDRAGEPVINTIPIDVEKFGFSPSELDLSKLRMIPESRVAAVTGIPAATLQLMVGLQNGTSYASSEQARQQGYEEVIIPIQQGWAEEFKWQLLPEFDDTQDAEFVFDTSNVRVLEEDKDALVKRESEVFRTGASTIDQFFTAIGKKPLGKPLGDFRMVPALSAPMAPDKFEDAGQISEEPEEDPLNADVISDVEKAQIARLMDMERMFADLESQMKDFSPK